MKQTVLFSLVLLLFSCSSQRSTEVAGFGSETTNGIVVSVTGVSSFSDVEVSVLPGSYNAATDAPELIRRSELNDSGMVELLVDPDSLYSLYIEDKASGKKYYLQKLLVSGDTVLTVQLSEPGEIEINFVNSENMLDTLNGYVYFKGYPTYFSMTQVEESNDSVQTLICDDIPASVIENLSYTVKEQEYDIHIVSDTVEVVSEDTTVVSTQLFYRYMTTRNSPILNDTVTVVELGYDREHVLIGTMSGGMTYRNNSFRFLNTDNADIRESQILSIVESSDSVAWFGTLHGITRLTEGSTQLYTSDRYDFLPGDLITSLTSLGDGYLWVGTDNGVNLISADNIWHFSAAGGQASLRSTALSIDSAGTLWGGTVQGYFSIDLDNKITEYPLNVMVNDILTRKDGKVVIATDYGVHLIDSTGMINYSGLVGTSVKAISEDSDEQLWFGTADGQLLYEDEDGTIYGFISPDNTILPGKTITSLVVDDQNNVLCGTHGYGLFILGPDAETLFYAK